MQCANTVISFMASWVTGLFSSRQSCHCFSHKLYIFLGLLFLVATPYLTAMDLQKLKKEKPELIPAIQPCNLIGEPGYELKLENQKLVSLDGIASVVLTYIGGGEWPIDKMPDLRIDSSSNELIGYQTIADLTRLKQLSLAENQLSAFEVMHGNLAKLTRLDLSANPSESTSWTGASLAT